jgi:RimJ/RimL family protein N-acetyltransferase
MVGRFCRLEALDPDRHGNDLHAANTLDDVGRHWTYLPYGPFESLDDYRAWMDNACRGDDPLFHAIVDAASGKAVGVASYLRIVPASGTIEIGHLHFSPLLQRRPAATEAIYLMLQRAFQLGYRRCEWKCDSLNAPSYRAAGRFGFTFEGTFRQATVYKGRSRDTAWFSIIDSEWPALRAAYGAWLAPENFDVKGQQRRRLSEFMP